MELSSGEQVAGEAICWWASPWLLLVPYGVESTAGLKATSNAYSRVVPTSSSRSWLDFRAIYEVLAKSPSPTLAEWRHQLQSVVSSRANGRCSVTSPQLVAQLEFCQKLRGSRHHVLPSLLLKLTAEA